MSYCIFTTLNQKYLKLGAAMIASVWQNCDLNVHIVILDTGIKKGDKDILIKWSISQNRFLSFIDVDENLFSKYFNKVKSFPDQLPYYARLLIPYVVSRDFDRVLYLDSDIICLRNFVELFYLELEDNIVACCQDKYFTRFSSRISDSINISVIKNYKKFGFCGDEKYFNSGVLLIDVPKWKRESISEKVLNVTLENSSDIFLWDQYGLNIALSGKWKSIDCCWNETTSVCNNETYFRHFVKKKPTEFKYNFSDQDVFFKFLDHSPWKGWRPSLSAYLFERIMRKIGKLIKVKNK